MPRVKLLINLVIHAACLAQGTPFQDAGRRTQDPGQRVTAGVYCPAPAPANGGALEHWRTWPGKWPRNYQLPAFKYQYL